MRIRAAIAMSAALSLLGVATSGSAAEVAAGAVAAPVQPTNAKAEALVRRYLEAIHFERTMDLVQAQMLPMLAEQARRERGFSKDDEQLLIEIVRKVMREKTMPKMIDRMVPIYASTFTVPELQAMVDFYESPVGRSITDKSPSLAPKSAEVVRQVMPDALPEVLREWLARKCPNGKCGATELPKPAAS